MSTQNTIFTVIAVAIIIILVWVGGAQKTPDAPVIETPITTETNEKNLQQSIESADSETNTIKKMTTVTMTTNQGVITFELFGDLKPKTVENFTKLAKEGFYDGTRFHRVIKGFMIQGGDPLSKEVANQPRWGTGGPGYSFADELSTENKNVIGTISMANSGPNTGGSQFFINLVSNDFLNSKHPAFGKVVEGMDVVNRIASVQTSLDDRPLEEVRIIKAELID